MTNIPAWQLGELVHQASGMVAEQLGCSIAEALCRLRIRADAAEVTLNEIALAVIDRQIRFS